MAFSWTFSWQRAINIPLRLHCLHCNASSLPISLSIFVLGVIASYRSCSFADGSARCIFFRVAECIAHCTHHHGQDETLRMKSFRFHRPAGKIRKMRIKIIKQHIHTFIHTKGFIRLYAVQTLALLPNTAEKRMLPTRRRGQFALIIDGHL